MTRRGQKLASRVKASGGFTLLEVLLAFVIFALSFAVVLEIISGSIRNTMHAKEYTEVALITQSVMDQVGLDIPLEPGTRTNGEVGAYTWELEINPFVATPENLRAAEISELTGIELLEVEFIITWGKYPRERSNRFTTVKAMLLEEGGLRI